MTNQFIPLHATKHSRSSMTKESKCNIKQSNTFQALKQFAIWSKHDGKNVKLEIKKTSQISKKWSSIPRRTKYFHLNAQ